MPRGAAGDSAEGICRLCDLHSGNVGNFTRPERIMQTKSAAAAAAVVLLAAACASVPATRPEQRLEARVGAVLERRGLGRDALSVIDNLLRHGARPPREAPAVVQELLARPLGAVDAAVLFRRSVPAALMEFPQEESLPAQASFDELLERYIGELASAAAMLRAATKPFDEDALLRRLGEGLPSANQLLAVADAVDMAQLERANLLFIEATLRFTRALRNIRDFPSEPRRFESAIGTVSIGTHGNDRHGPDVALIIDPGGDDVYERAPVRGGAVSVIVDLAGNDRYFGSDLALRGLSAIVELAGNDRYEMRGPGLGAAIAGASLLLDFAGDDAYDAGFFAQGAAAFGVAALVDFAGADRYRVQAWGQGFGLAGGVGLLWDRAGDDSYVSSGERDPFERGGGLSGAQGAAFGFRGLLGGGIGILRDDAGNDQYEAELFAQGIGYYYGLGLLWDRGGADHYRALRYAQGNGVHQAIGVLRDESGDDRYAIALGYGQGMGLDLAVGVLLDAAGDDVYRAHYGAQGAATANGFGLLADAGGDDRFELGPDAHAWGRAEWLRGLPSVGVLLHGAGARFQRDGSTVFGPAGDLGGPLGGAPIVAEAAQAPEAGRWRELEPSLCAFRALALHDSPDLAAAQSGLRSGCWRLQAAARAALERLGVPPDPAVALPSFLRAIPPQDELF